jgi:Na+/H+ antiporter NhaD/arsenite permease-like protein
MKPRQRALLLFVTLIALSFSPAWLACAADGSAPASPPAQTAASGQTASHAAVTTELGGAQEQLGVLLSYWSVTPFILILLAMAIVPLVHGQWWEANLNKGVVSFLCSLPILAYLVSLGPLGQEVLVDVLRDYYAFIVLLVALFTISGGIYLDGDLKATPIVNTAFLGIGALLASFIGTTGASILLIRPLIKTNQHRHHKVHIFIFFIFLAANIGGSLLPVGDPPLFLGYLYGVPFFWTFFSMWPMWLTTVAILLGVFYGWDTWAYSKEPTAVQKEAQLPRRLRLHGRANLLLIFGVLLSAVFLKAYQLQDGSHLDLAWMQQPVMILLTVLSFAMDYTPKQRAARGGHAAHITPRDRNIFTFGAMIEVAVLFIGIFITMTPVICLLKARGYETGVTEPWQFYWMSGGLSSFLDNAPTYATYFALGQGVTKGLLVSHPDLPVVMTTTGPIAWKILMAISLGSVFMGANTYIGNAPNFMVKSICEEAKIKMPSFFGYMRYSIGILIPTFLVVMFIYLI